METVPVTEMLCFCGVLDSGKCLQTEFLEWDVSDKVVKIFKTHISLSLSLSPSSKNRALYEIMLKNIVQLDGQVTDDSMENVHCMMDN